MIEKRLASEKNFVLFYLSNENRSFDDSGDDYLEVWRDLYVCLYVIVKYIEKADKMMDKNPG